MGCFLCGACAPVGLGDGCALPGRCQTCRDQALRALLASPPERARLGAAARRHVERRFDTARLVAAHHSLYTRLLGERAAAAAPVELK